MTKAGTPLTVKRHAGTRLADPAVGTDLTRNALAHRRGNSKDFIVVTEARTGEDLSSRGAQTDFCRA